MNFRIRFKLLWFYIYFIVRKDLSFHLFTFDQIFRNSDVIISISVKIKKNKNKNLTTYTFFI